MRQLYNAIILFIMAVILNFACSSCIEYTEDFDNQINKEVITDAVEDAAEDAEADGENSEEDSAFIGDVDGYKVSAYIYKFFLSDTKKTMEKENNDNLSSSEFWTDDRQQEAEKNAIEKARIWTAKYHIACDNGFVIIEESKEFIISQYEAYLEELYQKFKNYFKSREEFLKAYLGDKDYEACEEYLIKNDCVLMYRMSLEEVSNPTEESIREEYEANVDSYREVYMMTAKFEKKDSSAENEAVEKSVKEMYRQFIVSGTYTGSGINDITIIGDDNNVETVKNEYNNKSFEEIAEAENSYAQYNQSLKSKTIECFTKESAANGGVLGQFAISLEWADDTKTIIQSNSSDSNLQTVGNIINEDGTFKETGIKLLEDDNYFYITKCIGIEDVDYVVKLPDSSVDKVTVRDKVIAAVKTDMATKELENQVKAGGDKYKFNVTNEEKIKEINKEIFD